MSRTVMTRRILLAAVAALSLGAAPALAAPAAADAGAVSTASDPVFDPVSSNLAGKDWVSVTASRSAGTAAMAVDGDESTSWLPARGRSHPSLTLDLGGAYDNVRKIGLVFPDAQGTYRYLVKASSDGSHWTMVVDGSHNRTQGRGGEHLVTSPGMRYVKVVLLSTTEGARLGVSELSVWNYLRDDVTLGADISYADQDTANGLTYYVDDPATAGDILQTVSDAGMEYVRLRVFNDPRDERTGDYLSPAYQGPDRTLEVADRVVQQGMGLGIDLHYSDSWADPSKQAKPTAWRELSFDDLTTAVYDYTYETIAALVERGDTPAKVAVGNELINGFMWGSERPLPWFADTDWCGPCYFNTDPSFVSQPGGALLWDYWGSDDPAEQAAYDAAWDRFTTLQASGIKAVRDVAAAYGADIKVETHVIIDQGQGAKTLEFWNQYLSRLNAKGQDIDVIAHSYYPEWHGTPQEFEQNLRAIAAAHPGYELEVAETSHQSNDWDGLPVPNSPYPKTPEGAGQFYQRVFQIVNDLPDNRGVGVLVWEPANWQEMVDWSASAWPVITFNDAIKVYADSDTAFVLEDTVRRTVTNPSKGVVLPATVGLLDAATGAVEQIPVTWADVPSNPAPGELVVTGETARGEVTAIVDVLSRPGRHAPPPGAGRPKASARAGPQAEPRPAARAGPGGGRPRAPRPAAVPAGAAGRQVDARTTSCVGSVIAAGS
ncbi:glycosyl hydrolase 53 family protein [Actinotalea sp. M2MS4P-6]|uniref:glycosyl hydrolase 53 family protein n=1 Tax=Actinotalea sp. M2MS4P-6 TaxID=2983762 RepID=UPI0021E5080E|nr:glycosyl hydrolase 53 family protein [Actinotalea sp. M2MS4P-6]MCV2393282.1 glycosyl hydrolase 53 family protein [Actinotalea sp. M2MS4P-6]